MTNTKMNGNNLNINLTQVLAGQFKYHTFYSYIPEHAHKNEKR